MTGSDVTVVDGHKVKLPKDRSFVIGIEGGPRNPIQFTNWTGTSQHPIVITNKHATGRVQISDEVPGDPASPERNGLTLLHCQFIQVRGDNDPALRCGIEIARGATAGWQRQARSRGDRTQPGERSVKQRTFSMARNSALLPMRSPVVDVGEGHRGSVSA